jgi:hypothetical protein
MTKGYTTSEFWQSVFVQILALVGMFHIALPANTPNYVPVAALIVSGITSAWYTHSRQQIKVASINSPQPTQTTLVMRPTTTINPSDATTQTTVTTPGQNANDMPMPSV